MIVYKLISDDGSMLLTRSDTFPRLRDKRFITGFVYEDIKGASKNDKKYKIIGEGMYSGDCITDIIPLDYKLAEEEVLECMNEEMKAKWLKLDCNRDAIFKREEDYEYEHYYKKEKEDIIDDGINFEDTI